MMNDAKPPTVEYRPNRVLGLAFVALFLLTAAALIWVGAALGPEDVQAMDGFNRILFTAVPIRPFAWTGAIVFVLLGITIARRALRRQPTLSISSEGAILFPGRLLRWHDIASIQTKESEIVITISENALSHSSTFGSRPFRRLWARGGANDDCRVVLSSLALGASPTDVLAALEAARESYRVEPARV